MKLFLNSTTAQLILFIVAISSFIFAVIMGYFQWRNKPKKKLCYSKRSIALIQGGMDQIEALSHTFKGEKINNLTVANVVLWNVGNRAIQQSDIVPASPIQISTSINARILDKKIVDQSDEATQISLKPVDETRFILDFDYIGKGNGCAVQVYHTGNIEDLKLVGKIIDGNLYEANKPRYKTLSSLLSMSSVFFSMLAVMYMLLTASNPSLDDLMEAARNSFSISSYIILGLLLLLSVSASLLRLVYSSKRAPSKLKKYVATDNIISQLINKPEKKKP